MGKNPRIRITENDRAEYARLVKNTKAKIRNTVKNYGPIIHDVSRDENGQITLTTFDIRSKLSIPSLDSFKTRKEFNEWKESTQKFNSGKSPHSKFTKNKNGMVFTDYFKTVGENLEYKAEFQSRKEREKTANIPVERNGKVIGTLGQFAQLRKRPELLGYQPFKFNLNDFFNTQQVGKWLEKGVAKGTGEDIRQKKQTMMENWIKIIQWNFNSDADEIVEKVRQMGPDEFYEFYKYNVNDVVDHKWISFEYLPYPQKDGSYNEDNDLMDTVDGARDLINLIDHDLEVYERKKKDGKIYNHPHFD